MSVVEGKSVDEVYAYIHDTVYLPVSDDEAGQQRLQQYVPPALLHDWTFHTHLRDTFHLNDLGSVAFDQLGPILVNEPSRGIQRLLWRDQTSGQLREASLPDHVFDAVSAQFLAAYKKQA